MLCLLDRSHKHMLMLVIFQHMQLSARFVMIQGMRLDANPSVLRLRTAADRPVKPPFACSTPIVCFADHFCRLIDELRSTVRCKADSVWMDVKARSPKGLGFGW